MLDQDDMGNQGIRLNAFIKKGSLRPIVSAYKLVSKDWNIAQRLILKLLWATKEK